MIDFVEYVKRGGTVDKELFELYSIKAKEYIEFVTANNVNGKLNEYQQKKVDSATYDLIDWFANDAKISHHAHIASETLGKRSVSYAKKNESEKEKEKKQIITQHLSMTGLLYFGLR